MRSRRLPHPAYTGLSMSVLMILLTQQGDAMTATIKPTVKVEDVIEAMRSVQTEGDRWRLAEELAVLIPKGISEGDVSFTSIIDKATSAGVAGKLKVNTLRLYRDTASRWPEDKRVANVSFSAHREAMAVEGGVDKAAKLLVDLAKTGGGPDKVTVASVRKAVAIKQGKTKPAAAAKAGTTKAIDLLRDLESGGAAIIAAIDVNTDGALLDRYMAGLNKVTAHVEKLRAKAARKVQAAKAPVKATGPKPAATNGATKKPAAKRAGDMRNL